MKKVLAIFTAVSLVASAAFAADFTPTPLKISADPVIEYNFDGSDLTVPVTVTGVDGTGAFLVFTKDKASAIGNVTNGFLGWHHVNKIDTCVYVSSFQEMSKGSNNIIWSGNDQDGNQVPAGEYTYYVWAFDNVNPRVQVTKAVTMNPWIFRTILTHDTDGNPLANPLWYTGGGNRSKAPDPVNQTLEKWVIGSDPENLELKETTMATGWCGVGGIAFDPADRNKFFYDTLRVSGQKVTQKWEWVPNGAAVPDNDWGDDGRIMYNGAWSEGWNFGPGVLNIGDEYLMVVNADMGGQGTESQLIYLDVSDGTELQRLDLSEWWVDMNDADAGGQATGGPTELSMRNGMLFLGSHSTCVNQMIDPFYEDEEDAIKWTNTNGDYTGDHNFEPESTKPWVCNDYNVGPFKYNLAADANMFSVFPSFDMGAVSFGLYAPDGTGMGYHQLAGETAYQKYGVEFIDYGSAYDGIYTTNNLGASSDSKAIDATIWYVAHDSIKGTITNQVGVADDAPAAFSVAQNVPNPFNPTTTISFSLAKAGQTTIDVYNVAGQKVDTILNSSLSAGSHSVTWNAANFSAGVYFYTVKNGSFSKTVKMTLLK